MEMEFQKGYYIRYDNSFELETGGSEPPTKNPSLMLRKTFTVKEKPKRAEIIMCPLGIGYGFINGERITEDLFTAPYGDYRKTLWCLKYDVTHLIKDGENVIAFILGNGFYNEDMKNVWNGEQAPWRDAPKLICELYFDGEPFVWSDESWRASDDTPYISNRLRCGAVYDARKHDKNWDKLTFDDSCWHFAQKDEKPPAGKFRLCECEGIREFEKISPVSVKKTGDKKYLFDFGQNMSGYLKIKICQPSGEKIFFRYAEEADENGSLIYSDMMKRFYNCDFQTEVFICSGESEEWSNFFCYYGFRYVEAVGLDMSLHPEIYAVFVHQNVERRSEFSCSNEFLNKLFNCGIMSTYSNLFYMPTDCPTREKYGWMNDAQSSAEQILTDFKAERVLGKWNRDICDAMNEKGELPGIVPSHGWGYHWGNGPVSDGSLFEQAYRIYLHSGEKKYLTGNLKYFRKYLNMLKEKENEEGFIEYGLHDWANPDNNEVLTPTELINAVYRVKFTNIAALAARLSGEDDMEFAREAERQKELIINKYITEDGKCTVSEQTAIAMILYHGVYESPQIKSQLKKCVEDKQFHHSCGMVGIRHLYQALNKCGLQEYAYKIVTAQGYPSYSLWLENGATTLWELWDCTESKNHHMYSDVLSWMIKTIGGISPDDNAATFEQIEVKPYYFKELSWAKTSYDSPVGIVRCEWKREEGKIILKIEAPNDRCVQYRGAYLKKGENIFVMDENNM